MRAMEGFLSTSSLMLALRRRPRTGASDNLLNGGALPPQRRLIPELEYPPWGSSRACSARPRPTMIHRSIRASLAPAARARSASVRYWDARRA